MEENNITGNINEQWDIGTTAPQDALNGKATSAVGRGILEKISFVVLFAVAFLLPIFFVPVSFISIQFGTSLLFAFGVILVTLVMIVSSLISGSFDLPRPAKYAFGLMALTPLVYILAGIANGFSRMSFFGYTFDQSSVGFMLLAFLFMFFVSILFRNEKRIFYSYVGFVFSSILLSVFLLARIALGVKFLSFGLFTDLTQTTVGNWSNLGIFFGIGAILSLITYETLDLSKFMKIILSLALLLSLFFLALVNFSVIWIILGVCSVLFILYEIFGKEKEKERETVLSRVPLYPTIVLVISVVFFVWGGTLGSYLSNRLNVTSVDVRPSLSVTIDIIRNTLKNQPLFGSGPNSFVTQWLSYKPSDIVNTAFWNTDFAYGIGLLPTFAVTTGIVGILSWFVFFGLYLYLGMKSLFAKIYDDFVKYLVTSSFFVSLYLWIMAWVYVPSAVIFVLTFFFTGLFFASIYIAGIVSVSPYKFSNTPKSGFIYSFVLVLLFVGVGALGYGLFKNSESLWYFQKSSYAINTNGDITASETFMNKAISAVPYDIYYRSLAQIELLKLNAILSQDTTKVSKEDIQKQYSVALPLAITAGLSARGADQTNYLNWISLGQVYESAVPYGVSGAYESAQFSYNEALRRNPKNPGIYLLLAKLEMDKPDLKQARIYAQTAISMKKDYLDAYYLLSQIEVADKNLKGAIDSETAASVISPNDPSVFFQLGILKYNNQDFVGAIDALEKSVALAPDYANAKYFLGLSYEQNKQHSKAIAEFQDLKKTNPDNAQVSDILSALQAGKSIFTSPTQSKTTTSGSNLPIKQSQ